MTTARCSVLLLGASLSSGEGRPGSKRGDLNSNNMVRHAKTHHPQEWKVIEEEENMAAETAKEEMEIARKKDETEKGGNKVWCLKSRNERLNFFKWVCRFIFYCEFISKNIYFLFFIYL